MGKIKVTACSNCEHFESGFCKILDEEIPDHYFYGNWRYIPTNCPLPIDEVDPYVKEKSNGTEN